YRGILAPKNLYNRAVQFFIDTKKSITAVPSISYLLLLAVSICDFALIALLFTYRTDSLLISPWQVLPAWFFILFALSTFFLFIFYRNVSQTISYLLSLILTSLHLFVIYSVAAILYKLGFGFDAFVHRATEIWIQNHGFISPKTPYYIGQYSFVVWLSNITKIPIFYVDIYLVPILAAITLPVTITKTLKAAWDIPYKKSILVLWLIPFIPFLSFNLTTPYNLAILFSLLSIFTILPVLIPNNNQHSTINHYTNLSILLAFCALITHLLIGAPITIFVLGSILLKRFELNKKLSIALLTLSVFITALIIPLLFTINNYIAGAGLPELTNPFLHLADFISLFQRPYWYASTSPLRFEILYAWERIIIPIAIIISFFGFYLYQKEKKNLAAFLLPLTSFALVISAWFLRSWITFHDVVSYEQGDYPARLIRASLMFLLPFGMSLLSRISYNIPRTNKNALNVIYYVIFAFAIMLSLYFSYPQRNVKARFPGYNVTANHFQAVEWIHNQETTNNEQLAINYIVLADQITSAAALTDYSFAKYYRVKRDHAEGGGNTPQEIFYYSIPTGGILYQQYGKMIYEGQKREYMIDAMNLVGVDTAYFVVNSYWANSQKIIEGAKKTADDWREFGDGQVWVFLYKR
ncbi:MAG: hypothetical protein KBD73_03895, partial [Candidatus Magasanikbacteria bacterium]|nr:hypothetical protein [Candidatus Magasanikbacteria bacterium]